MFQQNQLHLSLSNKTTPPDDLVVSLGLGYQYYDQYH